MAPEAKQFFIGIMNILFTGLAVLNLSEAVRFLLEVYNPDVYYSVQDIDMVSKWLKTISFIGAVIYWSINIPASIKRIKQEREAKDLRLKIERMKALEAEEAMRAEFEKARYYENKNKQAVNE